MLMGRLVVTMFLGGLMMLGPDAARGQGYPNKPIRIVTTGSGGATDIVLRVIAPALNGSLGQAIIIDNRAGITAAEIVSRAPADGYTLYVGGDALWLGPFLQKMPYDPVKDFSPVSLMNRTPSILVVHPSLPVRAVPELIALAKAKPGELNYGSSLTGGSNHLAAELFKAMAGVNIVRVPYKSGGLALNAMLAGEVQLTFATTGTVTAQLNSGRLRALAVSTAQPSALFPGLPTIAASGLPGYEYETVQALFAPAGTPGAIIDRLHREMAQALAKAEVREKLLSMGVEAASTTPGQLALLIRTGMARMGKVIRDAGIRPE